MKRASLAELSHRVFDIVVIGGGVTGVAIARDAAGRGLSVLLLEKDDFASGTSSRSSKLIHGGLRYLETCQFRLVAESLKERELMLKLAPHLTDLQAFLFLLYGNSPEKKWQLRAGLSFYDLASGAWPARRHQMLSAQEVLRREPHLNADGLRGAGLFYDVRTDDARLTLDIAKSASAAGALLVNHAQVVGLLVQDGTISGVTVYDSLHQTSWPIHARRVVNATGPWTEHTCAMVEDAESPRLRLTKGVHIAVRKADFPLNTALFLRSPDDRRIVWPIPAQDEDRVYIGTTDTDFSGHPDAVFPSEQDVVYLLNVANFALPEAQLKPHHVVGAWAGLRPLLAPGAGTSTGDTSREHRIIRSTSGMLTVAGGKLTSHRVMARQLVDLVARDLSNTRRSDTDGKPLAGANMAEIPAIIAEAKSAGVPDDVCTRWVRRYGSNARHILSRWQDQPVSRQQFGVRSLCRAEIEYAVADEMVYSLADLLIRRTGLFFWDESGGRDALAPIADILAERLAWSAQRRQQEIDGYLGVLSRHRWT